jgi:transcriptional regulator NrdR family protein
MPRDSNQLNIRVDEDIKKAFILKAKEKNTSATELLVSFMKKYLGMEEKGVDDEKLEKLINELENRLRREFQEELTKVKAEYVGELNV